MRHRIVKLIILLILCFFPSYYGKLSRIHSNNVETLQKHDSLPKAASGYNITISEPWYKQVIYYYCGDACIAQLFDYYGENITQYEIADVARTQSTGGTWEDDMRRAVHFSNQSTSVGNEITPANITGYTPRSYGWVAFEQHFATVEDLIPFISNEKKIYEKKLIISE